MALDRAAGSHDARLVGAISPAQKMQALCRRRAVRTRAVSSSPVLTLAPSAANQVDRSIQHRDRLIKLVELRALYRNFVRAKFLLRLSSPVYTLPPPQTGTAPGEEVSEELLKEQEAKELERRKDAVEAVAEMLLTAEQLKSGLRLVPPSFGDIFLPSASTSPAAGSGGASSVSTSSTVPSATTASQSPAQAEESVRERARALAQELRDRVAVELPLLPFPNEVTALAAIEQRNARFYKGLQQPGGDGAPAGSQGGSSTSSPTSGSTRPPTPSLFTSASTSSRSFSSLQQPQTGGEKGGMGGEAGSSGQPSHSVSLGGEGVVLSSPSQLALPAAGQEAAQQLVSGIERLGQAEKVAEKFMSTRIKPALRRARETEIVDLVKETGAYLKGLWTRLNGGGLRNREPPLDRDLPLPAPTKQQREVTISLLCMEMDATEQKLREAAKAREARLRRARAPEGRATMPVQLKTMDEEVLRLSRELAIRTLQVELEYAYGALEDEALDIVGSDVDDLLSRQGSTTELRLLAAELAYLDQQLAALATQLGAETNSGSNSNSSSSSTLSVTVTTTTSQAASTGNANGSAGGAGGAASSSGHGGGGSERQREGSSNRVFEVDGLVVNVEDLLAALANEVPDLRQRVGVGDQVVYGGQGLTLTKARLQVKEAIDKVRDAISFMGRGLKLLGSDVASAARLFGKAAMGGNLKPREVSALRRTALDLLTFIPFTIILIIPLTPLGHVLIFGFIQTNFPSLFPSCFTPKRIDLMIRYEELERQLLTARMQAEAAEDEADLIRAAAAVARLSLPDLTSRPQTRASQALLDTEERVQVGVMERGGSGAGALRQGTDEGSGIRTAEVGSERVGEVGGSGRGGREGKGGREDVSSGAGEGARAWSGKLGERGEGVREGEGEAQGSTASSSGSHQNAANGSKNGSGGCLRGGEEGREEVLRSRSASPVGVWMAGEGQGAQGVGKTGTEGKEQITRQASEGRSERSQRRAAQRLQAQESIWRTSIDELDDVVSQQAAQVKALEEKVAAVLDDVTLGEEDVSESVLPRER